MGVFNSVTNIMTAILVLHSPLPRALADMKELISGLVVPPKDST